MYFSAHVGSIIFTSEVLVSTNLAIAAVAEVVKPSTTPLTVNCIHELEINRNHELPLYQNELFIH